jgi:GrpB-like predicted nucleotidyltransferase (UPF0157 family)
MPIDPAPIESVEVFAYDPSWADKFKSYAARLRPVLGELIVEIEHVGSTSVPGLTAKPIIDLDIIISSRVLLEKVITKLATINYVHEGNLGIPGREAFRWPEGERHHLYVCSVDTPNLHNHLMVRDYLREHPEAAFEYSQLKAQLALRHKDDIDSYSAAKSVFIEGILDKAQEKYGFNMLEAAFN